MAVVTCPDYTERLRIVSIDYVVSGKLDIKAAHEAPEAVLFALWQEAVSSMMAPPEQQRFLALPESAKRTYFPAPSVFHFDRFRDEFLASGRKKANILLN